MCRADELMVWVRFRLMAVVTMVAGTVAISGCNGTATRGDPIGGGLRPVLERFTDVWIEQQIRDHGFVLVLMEGRYMLVRPEGTTHRGARFSDGALPFNEPIRSLEEWLFLSSPLDRLPTELADRQYADCLLFVGVMDDAPCETYAAVQAAIRASGHSCTLWPVVVRPAWEIDSGDGTATPAVFVTRSTCQ